MTDPDPDGDVADVLVAGETLVDFVPDSDAPLADVESFTRRAGGAPANVAVALSRLGRPPAFWTRVGADPFGDFLAARLRAEGVCDDHVERDPAAPTTLAFVSHAGDDPSFTFYRDGAADTRLEPERVPDDALAGAEWVHVGGVALSTEPARSATLALVERAAERGCTVSFDPNVRPELWSNEAELATVCGWAVEAADVLVATPAEVRRLGLADGGSGADPGRDGDAGGGPGQDGDAGGGPEQDDPEALARAATDAGPHTVVLTLGADGAVAVATDAAPWAGSARHDGHDVDAVDPTGAGDAFAAGLIDALLAGRDLAGALAFANAVGASATRARGAMEALPTREAALELVEAER